MVAATARSLGYGANVEVLVRYQTHWARGFEVVDNEIRPTG